MQVIEHLSTLNPVARLAVINAMSRNKLINAIAGHTGGDPTRDNPTLPTDWREYCDTDELRQMAADYARNHSRAA